MNTLVPSGVRAALQAPRPQVVRTDGRWLDVALDRPLAAGNAEGWLVCLAQDDTASSYYCHPNVSLDRAVRSGVAPLVQVQPEAGGTGFRSLAVLAAYTARIRPLPGLPWTVGLRGRRLVGNAILGEVSDETLDGFLDGVAGLFATGRADCVYLEDVQTTSPLWQAAARARQQRRDLVVAYPRPVQPHWWIEFPAKPDDYWTQQFSGPTRRTLKKKLKKFAHEIRYFTKSDDVEPFLARAHELSAKSWQGKRLGLRIRNDERERALWGQVARLGAFRSYVLEHEGRPVSFGLGAQWNGHYFFEEMGFDAELADLSPGTVLTARILEDLIARDTPRFFDFGYGDGPYKHYFGNRQTASGPVLLVRRGLVPLTALRLEQAHQAVARLVRAGLKKCSVFGVLRKLYRRKV